MAIGISVFDNIVYYGPHPINYPVVGTIKAKEKVNIVWREKEWFYIEYFDGNHKKRGYIQDLFISYIIGSVVEIPLVSSNKITIANAISYLGPIPNVYERAGSVFEFEPLTVFNVSLGNYTFVEYKISNNQRKRAYVPTSIINYNAKSELIPYIGLRLADFSDESAYGSGSFYRALRGQCTWYCWGRAKEKCKKRLTLGYPNHAHDWFQNCQSGYQEKATPQAKSMKNAIACFIGGNYGHVVFIEDVEGDLVFFTEANVNNNNIVDSYDGILRCKPEEQFRNHLGKSLQGYIVL